MSYDDAKITFFDGTEISVKQGAGDIIYDGGKDYWGFQHIREIKDFYDAVRENREPMISGEEISYATEMSIIKNTSIKSHL